jgi:CHAT domain-containing protein
MHHHYWQYFFRSIWRRWRYSFLVLVSAIAISFLPPAMATVPPTPVVVAQQPITAAEWMQAGRDRYGLAQYADAVTAWETAARLYASSDDAISAASGHSNLGLAYSQLGQYERAETEIATARRLLEEVSQRNRQSDYRRRIQAQVESAAGQLAMIQGKGTEALNHLEIAADLYGELGDRAGLIRTQLNQAQILRVQGRVPLMQRSLNQVQVQLEALTDADPLKASGLRQLGVAQQLAGKTAEAEQTLLDSLRVANASGSATDISATLLSLGNLTDAALVPDVALDYYQRAATIAPTPLARLQGQVNALNVLIQTHQMAAARSLLTSIQAELPELPPSRSAFFVRINLASQLLKANPPLMPAAEVAQLLATTVQQAHTLEDGQGKTYGLGYLGRLYEQNQRWDQAASVTEQALAIAQTTNTNTATYQWQWQLGRIYKAQGQTEAAIAAYREALATLTQLRSDLVAVNADLRFSFRQEIEPVYRDLVSLLLETDSSGDTAQDNLLQARNVIESLQVEELVNFFRADCVVTTPKQIDQIDTDAAVIYPIILDDRLEVVLSLPGQPLMHHPVAVEKSIINATLDQILRAVSLRNLSLPERSSQARSGNAGINVEVIELGAVEDYLEPAQQVYDWLIRPFETDLAGTETLVFVLDGVLRNVPMAVLHDGEQYLIEKYAIALTPGLQLLDPQPLAQRQVRALVGGLSEARNDLPALPNVKAEVSAIAAEVPSEVLLDQSFDRQTFGNELTTAPFPVVHLATHGQFGKSLQETYIFTWDGTINANELSNLLQTSEIARDSAIEMLVLSACETAAGDDRAALGLAGVAVRSGARSTLATLWLVDDEGTSVLMSNLYKQLATTRKTKAEVLRQAQLNLLSNEKYQHPYFWAPFVLIGNWL